MKLAIDASRANRKQKTGVEWYAFYVITEIIKNLSDDDTLILYFQEEPVQEWGSVIRETKNVNVKVLNWPPKFLWTHIRLGFQTFVDKPEVLFIPAHVIPILHRGKAVMTLHDVAFYYFKQSYSLTQNIYQRVAIWLARNLAAHIISPTQITKTDLVELFCVPKEKISVVSHGINIDEYKKEIKSYSNNKYILFVGRIEAKKNLIVMIKAFEAIKQEVSSFSDLQFILVGKPGHGYDEIKKYCDESEYKEDIIFKGWVKQDEIPILYKSAQAFVYATLYEGFGMPIYEAFAAKLPVITSNQGATFEITKDFGITLNPHSDVEIANAIKKVLIEGVISEKKLDQAYKYVDSATWAKCGRETYKILKNMV